MLVRLESLEQENNSLKTKVATLGWDLDRVGGGAHLRTFGYAWTQDKSDNELVAIAQRLDRTERLTAASYHKNFGDWRKHSGNIRPTLE